MTAGLTARHPAAQWALEVGFNAEQMDCTTAVVLKILDNKCKMLPGEKAAVLSIYDTLRQLHVQLFGKAVHEAIQAMRLSPSEEVVAAIHQFRVQAEASIPKPMMKSYKTLLRDALFG